MVGNTVLGLTMVGPSSPLKSRNDWFELELSHRVSGSSKPWLSKVLKLKPEKSLMPALSISRSISALMSMSRTSMKDIESEAFRKRSIAVVMVVRLSMPPSLLMSNLQPGTTKKIILIQRMGKNWNSEAATTCEQVGNTRRSVNKCDTCPNTLEELH